MYDHLNSISLGNWMNHATGPDFGSSELEGRIALFNRQEIFR